MYLYIDTTSEPGRLALLSGKAERIVDEVVLGRKNRLSEMLLPGANSLLEGNNLKKKDLKAILVHPGPGSYTGVRIGVATANLLAFSLNIPIYSFDLNKRKKYKLKQGNASEFISPIMTIYNSSPTITQKKSRLGR